MLTEGSYHTALTIYALAAFAVLLLGNLWILKGRSAGVRLLVSLPLAALFLTPAFTQPGGDTFAPAMIVLAFQWLSQGAEAATYALRALAVFTGAALLLAVVLALLLRWRSRRAER
ncbi:MAG: hypothetical protein ACI87W_001260 [Halieaceae bacterium]